MTIGIYRGHFDPLHVGRVNVAKKLKSKYRLDKLVFVPIYESPHKKRVLTDGVHRINIAKRSVEPFGEVDDFEIISEGKAKAIHTIRYYHHKYPEDHIILFLDSRSLEDFDTWEDNDELLKICEVVIFQTTNVLPHKHIAIKYRLNVSANIFTEDDVLSSLDYRKGKLDLIKPKAQEYIGKNFLYLDDFLSGLYSETNLNKAYKSAQFALAIAKNNKISPKKAYYATLLRGIGSKSNISTQIKYLEKFTNNVYSINGYNISGPFTSKWLEHEYKMDDKDILKAIHNHTLVPDKSFTRLDKLVYVVNLLYNSKFRGLWQFEKLLIDNFEKGLKEMLKFVEIYYLKHKIQDKSLLHNLRGII